MYFIFIYLQKILCSVMAYLRRIKAPFKKLKFIDL